MPQLWYCTSSETINIYMRSKFGNEGCVVLSRKFRTKGQDILLTDGDVVKVC